MNLAKPLIGMDIGESSIKLTVVSKKGDRVTLEYADILPIHHAGNEQSAESETIFRLKELFKKEAFKKRPIIMNYMGKAPLIRYLRLPEMPEHELFEAIQWEAKKISTDPPESKVIDYAVLQKCREGDKTHLEIILVIVDKSDVSGGL